MFTDDLIQNGALRLTTDTDQAALVVFDRTTTGPCRRVTADFEMSCTPGADGFSFQILSTSSYGATGLGPFASAATPPTFLEEPALSHSLAIGFQIHDPYDYQNLGAHEVSLHWDGVELKKRMSSFDFRTGGFIPIHVEIEFVAGGAEASVSLAGNTVYDHEFIPGPEPFEARVAFGARTGSLSFISKLDNVKIDFLDPWTAFAAPVVVSLCDRVWISGKNQKSEKSARLPKNTAPWERILLRVRLAEPANKFDVLDRGMAFSVLENDELFEIARFITPFAQGGTWFADVTDFQALLRDVRQFRGFIDTPAPPEGGPLGSGWLLTADLLFFAGEPKWEAFHVENLWNGSPHYGDAEAPIASFFTERRPVIDPRAGRVKLRFVVTGHGQAPNTGNAAEFLKRGRMLAAEGNQIYNLLWRNDCYLNPVRPQSGTWQYSRAGWCPGSEAFPWEVDVTPLAKPGRPLVLNYTPDPYWNKSIDPANPARQWVASQLIAYRKVSPVSPVLEQIRGDSGLILRWPAWADHHALWSSSSDGEAVSAWTRVEQTPLVQSNFFVVFIPPGHETNRSYRLESVAAP